MREVLKTSRRWLSTGWILPLALLALPNCMLDSGPYPGAGEPPNVFNAGPMPRTGAILCDFPKPPNTENNVFECATDEEVAEQIGISLTAAAIALVEGQSADVAFDWSDAATAACNGNPRKIEFIAGKFPTGETICLNCETQFGTLDPVYANPTKACMAKCEDLVWLSSDGIVDEAVWCAEHAKVSTNFGSDCALGVCTDGGTPIGDFDHPRKHQEPVEWIPFEGVEAFDANPNDNSSALNSLKRTADTTGAMDSDFNAGSASKQAIFGGDAWVEFEAGPDQTNLSHVIGLREDCDGCADNDHTLAGIGFALSLNYDGNVYVLEQGDPLVVVGMFDPPTYTGGERYRVKATQKGNGTAEISYHRVLPGCVDGIQCPTQLLHTSPTVANYPLRVDAIFREKDATLENVTIVRIKN